jgi:hypothetical protein
MDVKVKKWFSSLTVEQRRIADALRELILSRESLLTEEFKWNQPCYIGNSMVCYLQKAKKHVALGFREGAKLTDQNRKLEGQGDQMRHVKIRLGSEIERQQLATLIDEALAFDRKS